MFLTHTNSVYAEDITLLDKVNYPQYVHQVYDGGMLIRTGMRMVPGELVEYVLRGKQGAPEGTYQFIQTLTKSPDCRVGLILASGGTKWTGFTSPLTPSADYPIFKFPTLALTQTYAGYIANKIGGEFEYISTDSTTCISGHSAWYTAQNMLALNLLDAVVVIATDNGISEDYLAVFGEHGLCKLVDEEDDPEVTKFRLGQGCNISVFESDSSRHAPIAKVTDVYTAAEKYASPQGISPEGTGYRKVIERGDTENIDFVKSHSTFSKDNEIEEKLIREKFGDIRIVNYKLRIGHTMGPATAIETALAIQEESGKFLSLGAGMGNVFSSVVVDIL